jgi:hypothetical protein
MKSYKGELFVRVPKNSKLKGISWQTLHFYWFLLSRTIRQKTNGLWIPCWSKTLKKKYGKSYKSHIDRAIALGWVERNPRYSVGTFSKSFRISLQNIQAPHRDHSIPVQKRIWEKIANKTIDDTSILDSDYTQLLKDRHDTLRITKASTPLVKELKMKLDFGVANVKTTRSGRVYSTILGSNKTTRKHVIFGRFGKLANVDVTGMVQQQLNKDLKDPEWDKMIQGDFLNCLKKEIGSVSKRDKLKEAFMIAISRGNPTGEPRDIREFLYRRFPKIMEVVHDLNRTLKNVQAPTQFQESIFIQRFIMENQNLHMIPANDGVFCGEDDVVVIQARLEKFLRGEGLRGWTKIKFYTKQEKRLTTLEILESIQDTPQP